MFGASFDPLRVRAYREGPSPYAVAAGGNEQPPGLGVFRPRGGERPEDRADDRGRRAGSAPACSAAPSNSSTCGSPCSQKPYPAPSTTPRQYSLLPSNPRTEGQELIGCADGRNHPAVVTAVFRTCGLREEDLCLGEPLFTHSRCSADTLSLCESRVRNASDNKIRGRDQSRQSRPRTMRVIS